MDLRVAERPLILANIYIWQNKKNKNFKPLELGLNINYGQVAEWFKAAVLKTAVQQCTVSSNLTLSATKKGIGF